MTSKGVQLVKNLGKFKKPGVLDKGLGALLPEAYKKFYREWKLTAPTAVHYIPEEGRWKRNEITGEVSPIQNVPLPVLHPLESNKQLWGGEGIVQGFQVRGRSKLRVPHFWVPVLKRTVVYSEVLDKYIRVIVTDRTLQLINANYGFDHYLLKTPACDLKSLLALGLKRKILQELEKGCPTYSDRSDTQKNILGRYQKYLTAYTSEEIQWYGYSMTEAIYILQNQIDENEKKKITPLKHIYRAELIEKLRLESSREAAENTEGAISDSSGPAAWLQKINPFGKKHET